MYLIDSLEPILTPLSTARREQGIFLHELDTIKKPARLLLQTEALTHEVIGTARLACETLNHDDVYSFVARRLPNNPPSVRTVGIVEMLLDARKWGESFDYQRLSYWHLCLETYRQSKEQDLLSWLRTVEGTEGLLRSAMAHVSFPGNGMIRRAAATAALAQDDALSHRFVSLSEQFATAPAKYHDAVKRARRTPRGLTNWLLFYLETYVKALHKARERGGKRTAGFWIHHSEVTVTERQRAMLNRYLQEALGCLTARNWAAMAKTSIDTAERDLRDLVAKGLITSPPTAGKNTRYFLLRRN